MIKTIWFLWNNDPKLEVKDDNEWSSFKYIFGQRYGKKINLNFISKSENELCDIIEYGSYIMVSERIKKTLQKFNDTEVEYIPVVVERDASDINYYIMNVLTLCDCIDFDKSDVQIEFGEVFRIKKLIIDSSKANKLSFFLLAKSAVQLICFSEKVINELDDIGCSGVNFIPIEEYSQ